ncbi:MFS transporter [Luteipulveratus mongoliensis]|uniref:MFS transporter n=1 Tax=Luteipulveratus mongoliensis TaxID=571913 RepID=A0A0K1JM21_9MICO|nr:MFS transporter [Luteipulveratus mongoliensis]AKU17638.1 MFS transporter [Luteipulveratus mongoliensis]
MTSAQLTQAPTVPTTDEPARWSARRWILLLTLCTVLALDGLDVSMVGVALPSIGTELSMDTASLQWIVSAYVLGYGSLLLLGGRLADLLGRRRIFLIALSVFAIASLVGGLVSDPELLIASRFVKGLAAAFTAPTGFSIITTTFKEGPERNKAISIYSTFGASGFSLGLIVGGLMTALSWRWTFLASVPLAVAAVALGMRYIPRDRPSEEGGHDVLGAATLTAGMLGTVYTLVSAPEAGWGSARTIVGFVLSAAVLAAFAAVEQRVPHPLIRFGILREGWVARANVSIVVLFGAYISFQFVVTLYLQSVLGWSPLAMAMALLPAGIVVILSAPFADALIERFTAPRLVIAAMAALAVGYTLFLRIGTTPAYATDILPSVILLGVGFGLGFPAINVLATSGIRNEEQGLAAGLIQSSGQVGAALVLAVTSALVSGAEGEKGNAEAMLDNYRPGLLLCLLVAVAGLLIAAAPGRRRARADRLDVELAD